MNVTDTNIFVTAARTQAANLILTVEKMQALANKMTALDLANALNQANIGGDNEGVLIADVVAVLGTTLTALTTLLAQGHYTNLHKIARTA